MTELIRLDQLRKTYFRGKQPVKVFGDLNLSFDSGSFVSLMGPSGAGKTTLLNIVGGLDRPSSGKLFFDGEDITAMSDRHLTRWRAEHIGFVFQFYNLISALSAYRNVEIPLLLGRDSSKARRDKVKAALDLVGLPKRGDHRPSELSGGQQQRVAIARAIVSDPALILADEPTGDLDRDSAIEIMELLTMLNENMGKTIIMVTHDPRASAYAGRQLRVDRGVFEVDSEQDPE